MNQRGERGNQELLAVGRQFPPKSEALAGNYR